MNPDENDALVEAARAIAAGQPVDWATLESSGNLDDSMAAVLRELKVLDEIAELHRGLSDSSAVSEASSARNTAASLLTTAVASEMGSWGALQLLERVGHGSFGDVYRAWDPRLAREVALKLLKRPDSRHDSLGSLVIDEGRLLARVRHPNVVTVYGADRVDGRVGLWMEFVRGRTIEAVLRDHGPFGAQEAALIGLDLCRALSAVHRAGLIHRDVKAQNVMREAGGRVVLMDFGTGREDLAELPPEIAGTPLYLAPEVFEGKPATARGDIYSVGVLLYHLATGSYPVKGRSVAELRDAHLQRRRSWLRDDRPDLPAGFVQAVERALEVDPSLRYESAGAMEAALARFVSGADSANLTPVTTAAPAPVGSVTAKRWFSLRTLTMSAVAAAAVAGSIFVLAWRDRIAGGGGSIPAQHASVGFTSASTVVRKVNLAEGWMASPSADGKLLSISADDGNLAVIELATGELRRLTREAVRDDRGSQYAEFSAISPDNQTVAYAWYALDGKYELRAININGSQLRVLLRNESVDYLMPIEWSRDSRTILCTFIRPDGAAQLALVSSQTGSVQVITELASPARRASLSSDGEFIVYDAPQQQSASGRGIFIVRSNGSDERRLLDHPANDTNPVWTPDGRRVLFTSDRSGTLDVWSVAVDGGHVQGEPQVVQRNVGRTWLRGLTDTGAYFYELTVGAVEVYQADYVQGVVRNPSTLPVRYSGSNLGSVWSPEGSRLAYASRRGLIGFDRRSTTLVIRDLRTQQDRELVPAMNSFLPRAWLDGDHILATGLDFRDRWGNYRIDVTSGRATPIVLSERPSQDSDIGPAEPMPDGRIVYFNGAKRALLARSIQSSAEEVLVDLRAEGVAIRGGRYKLSPDGQTIAYTAFRQEGNASSSAVVMKVIGGGPLRELARGGPSETVSFQDWTPDGQSLLFTRASQTNESISLWRISIHGGNPESLGVSMVGLRDVSMHPGGTRITFTAGWPKKELWVIENFLK